MKKAARRQFIRIKNFINNNPKLKKNILDVLNHFPRVKQKLKLIGHQKVGYTAFKSSRTNPELLIDITHVYKQDLKTGIQRVVRAIMHELQKNDEITKAFDIEPVFITDIDGYWCYKYVKEPNIMVVPKKNDLFLGLDLNSNVIAAAQAGLFQDWKARKTKIHFVIYDILPILYPDWWHKGVSESHEEWLQTVIESSDQLLCISQTVSNDVKNYINEHQYNHSSIGWFHLGADIDSSMPSTGMPNNAHIILNKLKLQPSFLMVGTIEPRKGHQQTLAAFEKLWNEDLNVNLIIVGKEGWLVDELVTKIRNHREFNRRFFWLEAISDEYLEKIYATSTCLIIASEGEGFGLPLIEAAQHKLPIIARNIPVFHEVAGKFAYYFENSNDPSVLAKTVKNWLDIYSHDDHPTSDDMSWLTWEESVKQLINKVLT